MQLKWRRVFVLSSTGLTETYWPSAGKHISMTSQACTGIRCVAWAKGRRCSAELKWLRRMFWWISPHVCASFPFLKRTLFSFIFFFLVSASQRSVGHRSRSRCCWVNITSGTLASEIQRQTHACTDAHTDRHTPSTAVSESRLKCWRSQTV